MLAHLEAYTPKLESLTNFIFNVLETSEALGRSLIIRKDESLSKTISTKDSDEWFVCDDYTVSISFNVIPKEALAYLEQKSISIAGVESEALKQTVKDAIIKSINDGKPFAELKAEIDSLFDSYGVTRLSQAHLQTVFRTNVFAAYSIGQYKQATTMADRFPLVFFSAIEDGKSRHIPLIGYYYIVNAPLSPVDYNCRCTNRYIHISEITGNEHPIYSAPPRPDLIVFNQRDST